MKTVTPLCLIAFVLMLFVNGKVIAQTGTITGTVVDQQTGEPLSHSKVIIEATGHSVLTDEQGRFVLRRVPAGRHTVTFRSLGYASGELSLSLDSGASRVEAVALSGEFAEGDRIFVQTAQRAQARVLNREYGGTTMKSAITREQMNRFGDPSVQAALIRMPGVQAGALGELNIRGTGLNRYNVAIEGQRLATTGLGIQGVDLGMFSVDLFRDLEVAKVVGPDMYADGLGGVVNLRLFDPVGSNRAIEVNLGGGGDTGNLDFTGLGSRFSVRYSEALTEDLSLGLLLAQKRTGNAWETLEIQWEVADFGTGPEDVLERLAPGFNYNTANSIGGGLQLTYQPTHRDTYYLRGFANFDDQNQRNNFDNYIANRDWISPSETGVFDVNGNTGIGLYRHNAFLNDTRSQHMMLKAGAKHHFLFSNLEYGVGWNRMHISQQQYTIGFMRSVSDRVGLSDLNYGIDISNRSRPEMWITSPRLIMDDGAINIDFVSVSDYNLTENYQNEDLFSANLDFEIPLQSGFLKIGSLTHLRQIAREYDDMDLGYPRRFFMEKFRWLPQRNVMILDNYVMPYLIDSDIMRTFIDNRLIYFTNDKLARRQNSQIWNYDASEYLFAGYGMAQYQISRLELMGGVRVEHTNTSFNGYRVLAQDVANLEPVVKTDAEVSHTHLFPNAQIRYYLGERSHVHLAYSKTIQRTDFQSLNPFELISTEDLTIFRGNSGLEPILSDNFDFSVIHHSQNLGSLNAGLFYKDLSNFVVLEQKEVQLQRGQMEAFDHVMADDQNTILISETSFANSGQGAQLYGVELWWHQNLDFLPGLLRNLGTFANYTWTHSTMDSKRDDDITLVYQSPHAVNAALHYSQSRFFFQLAYHWTAEYMIQTGSQDLAPSISTSDPVFLDQYVNGWSDLSASFRFRISNQFRFWAYASNLLTRETIQYTHTRNLYPTNINSMTGRDVRIGISYNF